MEMSKSSYHRLVVEAGFRAYHPTQMQELSEDDFDRRVEFCETMLEKFNQNDRLVNKIIWSDESQFMLNGTINRHKSTGHRLIRTNKFRSATQSLE